MIDENTSTESTQTPPDNSQTEQSQPSSAVSPVSPPPSPTQPAPQPTSSTPQPTQLSDDQVSSLKDSITKDVSGKVSQEVSKSVIEKIGEALGLTKKQEEALPTDPQSLQRVVDERIKAGIEQFKNEQKQEVEQSQQTYQERVKEIQTGWFTQYDQLARSGKVPMIKDANDTNDAGVLARRRIILAIGSEIEKLRANGDTYIPSISDVILQNPNVLRGDVAGADLPISGNTAVKEQPFSNQEIRNKSMAQIASESN